MSFSLIGSVIDIITTILSTVGLPGLFALMAVESFGLPPLPSEVILPFAGFLVADGTYSFGGALAAALIGGLVGSFVAYAVGRWGREHIAGLGVGSLRLEERHLKRMDAYFARWGEVTVAGARLLPAVRSYISYPAGTARMSPFRFGVYTLIGATPFTVAFIYAGMLLRSRWNLVAVDLQYFDYVVYALIVVVVVYLLLLLAGVLTPGWPPHRASKHPKATPPAPPASPPSA
jgi:membrane protein DedA with SNARE-associated domain